LLFSLWQCFCNLTGKRRGRLYHRDDAAWLAKLLAEVESDPDDLTRLQLIGALRQVLGHAD
jgi:hypothetical protein